MWGWLTWAGIALRFLYVVTGIKGMVERWQARQRGREQERLDNTQDAIHDSEDAARIRDRLDSDPAYRDSVRDRFTRD